MRRDASFALVGDVGGTNARFAVADLQGARPSIVLTGAVLCKDHESLAAAADAFLASAGLAALPATATIAVAGPVADGAARLTNAPWDASEAELMELGFTRARLVNDFEALATGVADLAPEDSVAIGPQVEGLTRAPVTGPPRQGVAPCRDRAGIPPQVRKGLRISSPPMRRPCCMSSL